MEHPQTYQLMYRYLSTTYFLTELEIRINERYAEHRDLLVRGQKIIVESGLMHKVSKLKRGGIGAWFDRKPATALVQLHFPPNAELRILEIICETTKDGIAIGGLYLISAEECKNIGFVESSNASLALDKYYRPLTADLELKMTDGV